jgi:hypothetical protein
MEPFEREFAKIKHLFEHDSQIVKYVLEEPVTFIEPFNGMDVTRVDMNEDSFDIIIGMSKLTKEEINGFLGKIELGLFVANNIPFIYVATSQITVDMSINIMKMKEAYIDDWLNGTSDVVKMIIVDSDDMKLKALRIIKLPFLKQIREILRLQLPYSHEMLDAFIADAMDKYTTRQMKDLAIIKCKI